jgi:hypothetical protein
MAWLNDLYGGKFPIGLSLAIIATLIAAGIGLSLVIPPRPHAGGAGAAGRAATPDRARSPR